MTRHSNLFGLAAAGVIFAGVLASSRHTGAQTPKGITVSPAFQQVSILASQSEQPITFSLTNNETVPETLALSTQDFNTLDESGGLFFVGTNPTQLQKKYGLATWLSLPESHVTIQPKQTVQIKADIVNVPSMPAGGHYGALMLALAGSQNAGANNITIHPIASSLLFVDKLGGDTHLLNLTNVYIKHSRLSLPTNVTLRFHNDGNTHLIPRGTVTITNSSGKLISKGIINENSGIILPQTYRRYNVPLEKVSNSFLPGHYKLTVNFRFDGLSQYRTYQTSFWVSSPAGIAALIIGIVIIVVLLYLVIVLGKRVWKSAKPKN